MQERFPPPSSTIMRALEWYSAMAAQRFPNELPIPLPTFSIPRTQVSVIRYRERTLQRYWQRAPTLIALPQVNYIQCETQYYDVRWRIRCEGLADNCLLSSTRINLMECDSHVAGFFVQRCYWKDNERAHILVAGYANDGTRIAFDDLCWPRIILDVPASSTFMEPALAPEISQPPPTARTHRLLRSLVRPNPRPVDNPPLPANYSHSPLQIVIIPSGPPLDTQERERGHRHLLQMRPAYIPPDMSHTPRVHSIAHTTRRQREITTNEAHEYSFLANRVSIPPRRRQTCPSLERCLFPSLCPFKELGT